MPFGQTPKPTLLAEDEQIKLARLRLSRLRHIQRRLGCQRVDRDQVAVRAHPDRTCWFGDQSSDAATLVNEIGELSSAPIPAAPKFPVGQEKPHGPLGIFTNGGQ